MQDLVRIRVADAREDVRVGQRALERVVLTGDGAAELLRVAGEGIDPARVERLKRRLTPQEVYRRALLRARLGQRQRARREVEGGETDLTRHLGAAGLPVKPSRNHQVDREVQIAFELEEDALAQAAQSRDGAAVRLGDRWVERAQHERT